mmetsp:Transcript_21858/g.49821  ORF Transcript_21858/g.49821 Transcript_21858/m.49821 type:complete len:321 (+) Transcript_21858:47-1009(+)
MDVEPELGGVDGNAAAGKRRKKQKKKSPAAVQDKPQCEARDTAQDRLALFGEAFLDSIEGGVRPRKAPRMPRIVKDTPAMDVDELFPKQNSSASGSKAEVKSHSRVPKNAVKSATDSKVAEKRKEPRTSEDNDEDKDERARRVARPDRRRFMSDKVADIRSKPQIAQQGRKRKKRSEDDEIEQSGEFKKLLQDVWTYVTPHMDRGAAKQFEQAKIRAYGGTADKLIKMPYRMLKERQKQDAIKQQEKVEADKILGVVTSVDKHRNKRGVHQALSHRKQEIKSKYARQAASRQMGLGMGARERRGMAVIPKQALDKFSKKR